MLCATIALALLTQAACEYSDEIALAESRRSGDAPELIVALERGDPADRIRAALAMARIQSPLYAQPLILAARGDPTEVRLAALFALGQLGLAEGAEVPPPVVTVVAAALDDPDPLVVASALEALGKLATSEVPPTVTPFLGHDDPDVRIQAAMALFRARFVPLWRKEQETPPALPSESVEALVRSLEDPVERVRRAVAYSFSRYGQPEAVTALAARIGDDDEWTRLFAIRAVARSEGSEAADEVLAATADTSHRVRTEAVQALAAIGASDRIDAVLADDDSFHVRAALATALGQAGSAGSLAALARLEGDASSTVRAAAVEALAQRRGGEYAAGLARALSDDAWMLRAAAARAATGLGFAGWPLIRRAWTDDDPRVRAAAIEALGTIDEDPDGMVVEALSSSELAIRGTAVNVLSSRAGEDAEKLDLLRQAYAGSPGEEWIEVRESIVDALEANQAADGLLGEIAARDAAASVRNRARRLLAERGVEAPPVESIPIEPSALLGVRFDDDPIVVLETSRGPIRIRCLAREAPVHVAQFVGLVRDGFYDGLTWHRVVSNFVIQGGDPRGDGWGSAGETLRDEINRVPYLRGAVGMPKAGKDTGSCQIFITHIPTPHLDGNYTVYGRVESGLDVVDRIQVGDRIERAYVVE